MRNQSFWGTAIESDGTLNRRRFLAGVGTAGIIGATGCLDVIRGEEPLEITATPAVVPAGVLDETGYELSQQEEVVMEREFEAAGQTREVVVTNQQTEYEKTVDLGPLGEQQAAVFTILTTPQVNVVGREFNPVADMSTVELAEMVQEQYDNIQSMEHIEDTEITINEETTTQSKFRAEATFSGETMELFLHISEAVELGEDLVITVGGYPEVLPDEESNILQLMRGVTPGTQD